MITNRLKAISIALLLALTACGGDEKSSEEKSNKVVKDDKAPTKTADTGTQTGVKVVRVERHDLQSWIYSQGTARSRQREYLTFTQAGLVTHVDANLRVGKPVKAGQLIANQAPERVQADLQAAKASVSEAQASLALAEVTRQRYETLIEQRSASKQELDEAKVKVQQAKATLDNAKATLAQAELGVTESRLVSPINGVLARLNVEKGRYFSPNAVQSDTEQNALRTIPAMVINPNQFEVRVDLPSYDFAQLQVGARALVGGNPPTASSQTDEGQVEGTVYSVSPSLDPQSRTFEVIVHTEAKKSHLHDGEFVAVWIAEPAMENTLAVPLDSLRYRENKALVFVYVEASGSVEERQIDVGRQSGNYRAVLKGLQENELVVTEGRAALNSGQKVRLLQNLGDGK